jgi:hypothetical protein
MAKQGKTSQTVASQVMVAHGHPSNSISRGAGPRETFYPGGAGLQCHAANAFGALRQLEQELGVPIFERGQRYIGLIRGLVWQAWSCCAAHSSKTIRMYKK